MDYSQFKDDAAPANILAAISALAAEQKAAEREVEEAEEALAAAKAKLRDIAERRLPELMDSAEMEEFTTRDGIKVTVRETIRASLPKGREHLAFSWLEEHEHDGLIKREYKVPFSREQADAAQRLEEALRSLGFDFEAKQTIHPATLASFVKEQLSAGVDIPLEVFGAARVKASKITVKDRAQF